MTVFRGCIDLHQGKVKQIVGGTLHQDLLTNHTSTYPADYFANLYKSNGLTGSHVIKLGPGNDEAALAALSAWPDGLQIGGGIGIDNAAYWIDQGANKVIVTSWLFPEAEFSMDRLRQLSELLGTERLVVDLSCRRVEQGWTVAMNKWQTLTSLQVNEASISLMEEYCSELLVHAVDVEGLCQGIDQELVSALALWCKKPVTYAGGAKSINDFHLVKTLSQDKVDITFGSSLDIFGGQWVKFEDLIGLNNCIMPVE